jgi:hypothetical protein
MVSVLLPCCSDICCCFFEDAENILRYGTAEMFDQNSGLDCDNVYYSDDENACSNVIKADANVYDPLTE